MSKMVKKEIATKKAPNPEGSYSQGIIAGELIFTAGQIGKNPETGEMPEGIAEQTRQALENICAILHKADASAEDVIKVTVHLASFDDFDEFDGVYKTFFKKPYPVRTTVQSVLDGPLIEVDVMAVKR